MKQTIINSLADKYWYKLVHVRVAITESNVFNFLTTNHDNLNKKISPESLCFDTCIFNKHITFSIIIKKNIAHVMRVT